MFFSKDDFTLDLLKHHKIEHYLLHQVHGDHIVRRQPGLVKADGHWTDHRDQALIIKTADCLPVFLADRRRIMGLHMGWRAFTHNIFEKAMEHFDVPGRTQLFVGPHIGFESFQIDQENSERILKSQGLDLEDAIKKGLAKPSILKRQHFFINLLELLKRKALKHKVSKIHVHPVDTYRSASHYSHRRNRWRQGTNYSFIIK